MDIPTESTDQVNKFIEKHIYGISKLRYRWILNIALLKFKKNSKLQNISDLMEKDPDIIKFEMSR